MSFGAGV